MFYEESGVLNVHKLLDSLYLGRIGLEGFYCIEVLHARFGHLDCLCVEPILQEHPIDLVLSSLPGSRCDSMFLFLQKSLQEILKSFPSHVDQGYSGNAQMLSEGCAMPEERLRQR